MILKIIHVVAIIGFVMLVSDYRPETVLEHTAEAIENYISTSTSTNWILVHNKMNVHIKMFGNIKQYGSYIDTISTTRESEDVTGFQLYMSRAMHKVSIGLIVVPNPGCGMGKEIVDIIKDQCLSHGIHSLVATNISHVDDGPRRFWRREGFVDSGNDSIYTIPQQP